MPFLSLLALLILAGCFVSLIMFADGARHMRRLEDISPDPDLLGETVSIIVPACNEADTIEPALRSLLAQDYPQLEILVIEDRSTDGTWQILNGLAKEFPQLRLSRITSLPEGWLGKNHALYQGALAARGSILLFTDADVILEPDTVSRAVTCLHAELAEHLCLVFRNTTRGPLLNAMVVDALGGLFLLLRPWLVHRRTSSAFIGIGAFNMIMTDAYHRLGGHAAFPMHPIDDVMLGKKVKQAGTRQLCLLGGKFVTVPWYGSVREMTAGLMKNIFAMYDYRATLAATGVLGIVLAAIVPSWGVLLCRGETQLFFGLAVCCRLLLFARSARLLGAPFSILPCALLTPYLICFVISRATLSTLRNRGITWRGTHYPLRKLRTAEPLFTFFPAKRTQEH